MNGTTKKFICFIFSNDVEQAQYFIGEDIVDFSCKIVSVETEPYNLRQTLIDKHNVHFTRMEFLEKNKVFIMVDNYEEIPLLNVKNTDKEVDMLFKNQLMVFATSKLLSLNTELSKASTLSSKIRKKIKLRDRLQVVLNEFIYGKNKD